MNIELVIAHYTEPLAWLFEIPRGIDIQVYHKGQFGEYLGLRAFAPYARVAHLPNTGREAGTYLHHIVAQYDRLADVTVFLQGAPLDHCRYPYSILRSIQEGGPELENQGGFLALADCFTSDDEFGQPNHWERPLPVGAIYERVFSRPAPRHYNFGAGAQMAVTRELIQSKPREWWRAVQLVFGEFGSDAHAMERLWRNIFTEDL